MIIHNMKKALTLAAAMLIASAATINAQQEMARPILKNDRFLKATSNWQATA